uniref:Uncharacterized protein n=1 Tax=viral metagenome TaxID=1070528 RepID=A0A6C0LDW0_9ZZZZ
MGYNIDISIDMVKHPDLSGLKKEITDFAIDSGCGHYYYLYEIEGGGQRKRNHCIIVVNFDDESIFDCAYFLKKIKKNKDLHIECIYEDSIVCKLIYASRFYQTTMDRDKAIRYNKFKRERSLSDNEKTLLDEIV